MEGKSTASGGMVGILTTERVGMVAGGGGTWAVKEGRVLVQPEEEEGDRLDRPVAQEAETKTVERVRTMSCWSGKAVGASGAAGMARKRTSWHPRGAEDGMGDGGGVHRRRDVRECGGAKAPRSRDRGRRRRCHWLSGLLDDCWDCGCCTRWTTLVTRSYRHYQWYTIELIPWSR